VDNQVEDPVHCGRQQVINLKNHQAKTDDRQKKTMPNHAIIQVTHRVDI